MVLWTRKGGADVFRPKLRIKPKDSRSAFISLAGGDPDNRAVYRGRFLDLSVLGWALRNRHMDLNGFLRSFGLKPKMDHEPTGALKQTMTAPACIACQNSPSTNSVRDCTRMSLGHSSSTSAGL